MIFYILLAIHLALCVSMIFLVLIQQGQGADLGAVMGGSGNSVFGAAGAAGALTKATTAVAIGFMITSILLAKQYASGNIGAGVIADALSGSVMAGETDVNLIDPDAITMGDVPAVEGEVGAVAAVESVAGEVAEAGSAVAAGAAEVVGEVKEVVEGVAAAEVAAGADAMQKEAVQAVESGAAEVAGAAETVAAEVEGAAGEVVAEAESAAVK